MWKTIQIMQDCSNYFIFILSCAIGKYGHFFGDFEIEYGYRKRLTSVGKKIVMGCKWVDVVAAIDASQPARADPPDGTRGRVRSPRGETKP